MNRRFLFTLATTAWLTGLYLLYARFISPLVEPTQLALNPAVNVQAAVDPVGRELITSEHHSVAQSFLPEQDWAKEADNQYRVGDMFLYAMKVEQLNDKAEIRFRPFAMVWINPKAEAGEPPVRITAEAAVIRFQAAFDLDNPQPGRPVFGSLEGSVEIEGPNGLKVSGRGFTFSEEALKLWSDSDILFHYGPHRATGNGLQVDFLPATESAATADMPRLAGIRGISLLRQVALNLVGESKSTSRPGRRDEAAKEINRIQVTSDGRLQYDLESSLVTIEQNVRVAHPLPGVAKEGLNCDLLTLVVSTETSRQIRQSTPEGSEIELASNETAEDGNSSRISITRTDPFERDRPYKNWLPKHLELEKLLADGAGRRRVEIYSPSRELRGNVAQIEYDLVRRIVALRDPAKVDIFQSSHELHAPEVTLTFAENNRDVTFAIARGAGTATSRLKDGRIATSKWQKQLIKSVDPRSGLDLVELQGRAEIGLDAEYHLAGDALRIWMTPTATGQTKGAKGAIPSIPLVERVAGVGDVTLKSPQATSQNDWLDVRFLTGVLPAPAGESTQLFNLVPPDATQPRRGRRLQRGATAARPPMHVKSQRLSATVLRDRNQPTRMTLADLAAEGAIDITQSMSADASQPPVHMLGQILTVQNISAVQQIVELQGNAAANLDRPVPARIQSGAAWIEGPSIILNREENTLQVTGAGQLEYPVKTSFEGQPLDRPQLLHVQWVEALKFDGKTADFFEKVEAALDQTVMRCNAMHVTLVKPLRFDGPDLRQLNADTVQLARIFCENRVELVTCEYLQNVVVSRGAGRLGQFVIDNISGKTEALGPGHFMRWTLGQERRDPLASSDRTAKKPAAPVAPVGWTYSRVDFQGHMKGNIQERTATFEDHVEMVYGPVSHATDRIDPDTLPEGGAAMTCDSLKVSQFAESKSKSPHFYFSAERNTKLDLLWDGKPWYMMADEVKYDESKDSYLLLSNGDRKVVISKEPTSDNLDGKIVGSRVYLYPSLRKFNIDKATKIEGIQQ